MSRYHMDREMKKQVAEFNGSAEHKVTRKEVRKEETDNPSRMR